jgi:hypothetical protein
MRIPKLSHFYTNIDIIYLFINLLNQRRPKIRHIRLYNMPSMQVIVNQTT